MSAEILRVHPDEPQPDRIEYIVSCLRKGDVVALPTDTFYGLAVDPVNLYAVEQIYQIKTRQKHKPLSLLIGSLAQAYALARDTDALLDKLADRFWPGPLTIIVHAGTQVAIAFDGEHGPCGAARTGCRDSARGGGALRIADYGDLGEFAGSLRVHQRGMRSRSTGRPRSDDCGRRTIRAMHGPRRLSTLRWARDGGRFCARVRFRRMRL